MSELLIAIGEFSFSNPGYPQHGDILSVRPDGFEWGREERERALIVRVPDLTAQEAKQIFSADYKVKKSAAAAKQLDKNYYITIGIGNSTDSEYVEPDGNLARLRAYKFDFTQLTQEQQDIINQKVSQGHDNFKLYTDGLSQNINLQTKRLVAKEALPAEDLAADEQYISGFELRNLAKEF